MLSAAHVLAMDAKNLLDVIDSVRIRYPDLFTSDDARSIDTTQPTLCKSFFYSFILSF